MSINDTVLFVHVLAAMGMVAGGVVQVLAGTRVRAATTTHDLVSWARFTRGAGALIAFSALLSLMSGGHLAGAVWGGDMGGFSNPFITLGMLGLLLLAPIGPMMGGARLRRLVAAAEDHGQDALPTEVVDGARSPALWGPVHSLLGVAIGLTGLMIYKPGWFGGLLWLVIPFAAGWVVGAVMSRSAAPA
jgi:hypothetical protein